MNRNRHAMLLSVLSEVSDEQYYRYVRSLREGMPDLSKALNIARTSDGLIHGERDCERMVADAVEFSCLQAESAKLGVRARGDARQSLAEYKAQWNAMERLAQKMRRDACLFAEGHGGIEEHLRGHAQLNNAIRAIKITARLLEKFIEAQQSLLCDSGGNHRPFDRAFVRAIREVWRDITGREAGVSRTAVVAFAAELWTVFGFRPHPRRPLFDWLSERFDNIR